MKIDHLHCLCCLFDSVKRQKYLLLRKEGHFSTTSVTAIQKKFYANIYAPMSKIYSIHWFILPFCRCSSAQNNVIHEILPLGKRHLARYHSTTIQIKFHVNIAERYFDTNNSCTLVYTCLVHNVNGI